MGFEFDFVEIWSRWANHLMGKHAPLFEFDGDLDEVFRIGRFIVVIGAIYPLVEDGSDASFAVVFCIELDEVVAGFFDFEEGGIELLSQEYEVVRCGDIGWLGHGKSPDRGADFFAIFGGFIEGDLNL